MNFEKVKNRRSRIFEYREKCHDIVKNGRKHFYEILPSRIYDYEMYNGIKMKFSGNKSKKPSQVQKLARTAARKMPNRIEDEKNENPENPKNSKVEKTGTLLADTVTTYFITHVLPKINTPEYWREKVLEKRTENECKSQLEIIDLVVQLNTISDDYEGDFHSTDAFQTMYDDVLIVQNGQNWTASSWKLISIPMVVPPLRAGRVFLSGIFHSRANIDIFSNWSFTGEKNVDFKISPEPFAQSDEHQNIPLDENGPPYTQMRPADWLNQSEQNMSFDSAKNYSFEFNEFENVPIPSPVASIPSPVHPEASPVKTEDEEAFYGFKMGQPNISVVDAMELFHSIIEVNSKDEHHKPLQSNESTPRVGLNRKNGSRIEKRPTTEPLDRKLNRYIPMKFFAEFISSFISKK